MTKERAKAIKILRILSQGLFFLVFVFLFFRSLDPFSIVTNPFLRFDPLVFLTHLEFRLGIVLPILGLIIATLLLGRFYCGWICPLGSLIDLLDLLFKPIRALNPFRYLHSRLRRRWVDHPPSWLILGVVLVTVFFTPPPVLQLFHPNVWIVRIASLSTLGISFGGALILFSVFSRRLWCAELCPLGAFYGLIATASALRLSITRCSQCGVCDTCPTDAASFRTRSIRAHQCILCFDYEHRCPVSGFSYGRKRQSIDPHLGESRRLFLRQSSLLVGGLLFGTVTALMSRTSKTTLLRPPGVGDETRFVERCLRCFQCVRSCPNQIIKISGVQAGLDSLFTPHLEFHEYGCDYNCQVCQIVCPNFAIPLQPLSLKQKAKIGLASIDEHSCVVYAENRNCLVCEEFCPVPEKAIVFMEKQLIVKGEKINLRYPVVNMYLCIGCGICEAQCPTSPKAITVKRV